MIIMRLVVLIPLVARVHPIEVLGLAWPILVVPPIDLHTSHNQLLVPCLHEHEH